MITLEELPGFFGENDDTFPFKETVLHRVRLKQPKPVQENELFFQQDLSHVICLENFSNFCNANVIIQLLLSCGCFLWDVIFSNESSCDFSSLFINNYLLPYKQKSEMLSSRILREYVQEMLVKKPYVSYSDDEQQDASSFFLDVISLFCIPVQTCFLIRKKKAYSCFNCGGDYIEEISSQRMLLFLICFETQEEIEFQDLFFREVDRKCFNCNNISRLLILYF